MKPEDTRCVLNIVAPRRRCEKFKNILAPILKHVDHSSICVRVSPDETPFGKSSGDVTLKHGGGTIPSYHDNKEILSTPAIAVMLFLQERGENSVNDVQRYFKKYPWRLHHKIELNNKRTPSVKIAQQEYYALSREYPLWSLCPVYMGHEHLRLTLFVNRFSEMMEFYRLVTDTEMESTKPDFCLFPLSHDDDAQVFLCLKRSQHLQPFPLSRAYLTFKIRNINVFKGVLRSEMKEISSNRYLVYDPDGNRVILEVEASKGTNQADYENITEPIADVSYDVTSLKSACGSQDSGRFSDSDACASDLDSKGKPKSVHFDENEYDRMWIYPRDNDSKCHDQSSEFVDVNVPFGSEQGERTNLDMRVDGSHGAVSTRALSGMCSYRAFCAERADLHEPPNEVSRHHEQPVEIPHTVQLPAVVITDCSGNVHAYNDNLRPPEMEMEMCRVSQGNSETVNQFPSSEKYVLLSEEMYSNSFTFDNTDSTSAETGNGDAYPIAPSISENSRGDYSDSQLGYVNSSCVKKNSTGVDNYADGQLREDVARKRMVQPVYI